MASIQPPTDTHLLHRLRIILLANLLSTSIHYPHNYWKANLYPPLHPFFPTPLAYRIGIIIFWPLLTYAGYAGYRDYTSGTREGARKCIPAFLAYSLLGATSIGHFLGGVPQVHWFFILTIFTDFGAGVALQLMVWEIWSALRDFD